MQSEHIIKSLQVTGNAVLLPSELPQNGSYRVILDRKKNVLYLCKGDEYKFTDGGIISEELVELISAFFGFTGENYVVNFGEKHGMRSRRKDEVLTLYPFYADKINTDYTELNRIKPLVEEEPEEGDNDYDLLYQEIKQFEDDETEF